MKPALNHDQGNARAASGDSLCGMGMPARIVDRDQSQFRGNPASVSRPLSFDLPLTRPRKTGGGCQASPVLFIRRCSWRLPLSAIEPQRLAVKCGGRGRADLLNSQGRPALQFQRSPRGCALSFQQHVSCQGANAFEGHVERLSRSVGDANRHSERIIGSVQKGVGVFQNGDC